MQTPKTELLLRIGEHIYQGFLHGAWTFDETNGALTILTEASEGTIWLSIPENWYETVCLCGAPMQNGVCSVPDCVCSKEDKSYHLWHGAL